MSSTEIAVTPTIPRSEGRLTFLGITPNSMEDLMHFGNTVAKSGLVPKEYAGKPEMCLMAIQFGREIGLGMMQSLQSIAVINGKPGIYGDVMLALCRASPDFEWIRETIEVIDGVKTAVCVIKRKGEPERRTEFSVDDAKRAGLLGKEGTWRMYPDRMLMWRARGWCCRDTFGDVLKGIGSAEEMLDYEPSPYTATSTPQACNSPEMERQLAEFKKREKAYTRLARALQNGRVTLDQIESTLGRAVPDLWADMSDMCTIEELKELGKLVPIPSTPVTDEPAPIDTSFADENAPQGDSSASTPEVAQPTTNELELTPAPVVASGTPISASEKKRRIALLTTWGKLIDAGKIPEGEESQALAEIIGRVVEYEGFVNHITLEEVELVESYAGSVLK